MQIDEPRPRGGNILTREDVLSSSITASRKFALMTVGVVIIWGGVKLPPPSKFGIIDTPAQIKFIAAMH